MRGPDGAVGSSARELCEDDSSEDSEEEEEELESELRRRASASKAAVDMGSCEL